MLFFQKTTPLAQYQCQKIVNDTIPKIGISFDWAAMAPSMTDPSPGWNGNPNEEANAEWWKEYLDRVIKTIPLRGPTSIPSFKPFKMVGHLSSSIDPRTIVDEEFEKANDPPLDFSDLLNSPTSGQPTLELLPPHAQLVTDLPKDNRTLSTVSTEIVPPAITTESTIFISGREYL